MARILKIFAMIMAGLLLSSDSTIRAADRAWVGFVRKEATVALDTRGSLLEFLKAKDGRLSWTLTWLDDAKNRESLSMSEQGFFKVEGWFIYIESAARIWFFDGVGNLDLVEHA